MKKKLQTTLGKIEVAKTHPLCQGTMHFGVSAKLQELVCLLSQQCVFQEVEDLLSALLGLKFSAKQAQRISEHYGARLEDIEQDCSEKQVLKFKSAQEPVYVMFDGSMIQTRQNDWMEIKVGRAFTQSACISIQRDRNAIIHSDYLCHLGSSKSFLQKWERHIEPYEKKIFIADGAKWIWNYVEDAYSQSVQILDFFHAIEKLANYALLRYQDDEYRKQWLDVQKLRLLNNEVADIIKELKKLNVHAPQTRQALDDVLRYYKSNEARMQYKTYLDQGYLIGSGAMEAAHRNVVQQRLKLSGQRWSVSGAQQIANLRAYKKSERWNILVELVKNAA
ncbi:hypothetical protein [Niabella drilacis]|uniref:ISKra4 family transposase n=1 Tax=Niabella drilacis (strain DSM 25811 / CCM 8410 / CCUG 62505 / LMG 26954 / E90) TaxID=1285928 RepID=A0A1G6MQI9_NIADE|nr:hypothetical protein [Niabella drilacis]SDC57848.1 hypothetical protein SAMN04487894_1031 [Niabella drilacis]SDE14801.1 hypothetical protein SAMN04487894_12340 [Niabella drilacis]SDE32582.1 hypothetical protein SAMN04487894_1362 [Niabella drilacis]